jgi:predicted DNA binding CopG/RHH family protein
MSSPLDRQVDENGGSIRKRKKAPKMKTPEADARSQIPSFSSREEEAEFWDTHDFTDFQDELKPVKVTFTKNLSEPLTIRLDRETLTKLREQAHEKGIGPTTLARMWILERLRAERQ